MPPFAPLLQRAEDKKGGKKALMALMPEVASNKQLLAISDDRWLSMMSKGVFRAGFVWRVIEAKWDGFEAAFHGFNIEGNAHLSDDRLEALARDVRIVRNPQKIKTVRDNAIFIRDICETHGSFSQFVANWPADDVVGLWQLFKKQGARLGGNTGPMLLRMAGKDTFILTNDVAAALHNCHVLDSTNVQSKRAQSQAQAAFLEWQDETGLPLSHLSRIAAFSMGD